MTAEVSGHRQRALLRGLLSEQLTETGERWLTGALQQVADDAAAIRTLFPAAGRRCGRGPLAADLDEVGISEGAQTSTSSRSVQGRHTASGWTVDDAVRVLLLAALPLTGDALRDEVAALYRYGDAAEKRGVLRGLHLRDTTGDLGDSQLSLVHDALRTNDTRLIAAALGPYGARRLDVAAYRQGVLKCVFLGIPLDHVDALGERADAELARMLVDYAHERVAAGREVPADVWPVIDRYPEVLERSGLPAEVDSAVPARRQAAVRAMAGHTGAQRAAAPREEDT